MSYDFISTSSENVTIRDSFYKSNYIWIAIMSKNSKYRLDYLDGMERSFII